MIRVHRRLSGIAARRGTHRQRLYAADRDVIGDGPDVIVPPQWLGI
ncbi:hypothetical protein ACFY4H_18415 [Streptomyces althioticus]